VGKCLSAKALPSNGCVYLIIKNLLHSSECCFVVSRSLPSNGSKKGKGKVIPVTGREGPYGCERLRLLHLLDNRLTDGGKVVSLTAPGRFLVLISVRG
jgi:hypothetical protein